MQFDSCKEPYLTRKDNIRSTLLDLTFCGTSLLVVLHGTKVCISISLIYFEFTTKEILIF
jgi:hypothetical protein